MGGVGEPRRCAPLSTPLDAVISSEQNPYWLSQRDLHYMNNHDIIVTGLPDMIVPLGWRLAPAKAEAMCSAHYVDAPSRTLSYWHLWSATSLTHWVRWVTKSIRSSSSGQCQYWCFARWSSTNNPPAMLQSQELQVALFHNGNRSCFVLGEGTL